MGELREEKTRFFLKIMCGRVSSNTTNTADPSPSAGGCNPMPGHGTIGLSRLSSLNASTHWRTVTQPPTLRAMSTARNALVHLPVVNPKAKAHGLVDTLAPCSPSCSTGSTRSSRPSQARSSCVKVVCSFTAKGIQNPMVSIKHSSNLCRKSAVVQSGWTFLWIMKPSKCNEQ